MIDFDFSDDINEQKLYKSFLEEWITKKDTRQYSYSFKNFLEILKCLFDDVSEEKLLQSISSILIHKKYNKSDFDISLIYEPDFCDEDEDEEETEKSLTNKNMLQDYIQVLKF